MRQLLIGVIGGDALLGNEGDARHVERGLQDSSAAMWRSNSARLAFNASISSFIAVLPFPRRRGRPTRLMVFYFSQGRSLESATTAWESANSSIRSGGAFFGIRNDSIRRLRRIRCSHRQLGKGTSLTFQP